MIIRNGPRYTFEQMQALVNTFESMHGDSEAFSAHIAEAGWDLGIVYKTCVDIEQDYHSGIGEPLYIKGITTYIENVWEESVRVRAEARAKAQADRAAIYAANDEARRIKREAKAQAQAERELRKALPKPAKGAPRARPGYVYLVQSASGNYKIGRTVNPADRARTFNVKLPFEVEFLCLIKHDDHVTLERQLHKKYAAKRVNGEWFALTDEDVAYIKSLAGGAE